MRNRKQLIRGLGHTPMLSLAAAAVVGSAMPALAEFKIATGGPVLTLQSGFGQINSTAQGMNNLGLTDAAGTVDLRESTRGGATSSATSRVYTGPAGGVFSTAGNWTPSGTPVAGDDLSFTTAPTGNYSVTNDLSSTVFHDLVVNRGAAATSATTTLAGGYSGNRIDVLSGGLTLNGGTTAVTSELVTATTTYSIRVGDGATSSAGGALTISGGAKVTYNDFIYGTTAGKSAVVITGAGTEVKPLTQAVDFQSAFRGGGSGTSTILIDNGASMTANFHLSSYKETFTVSNNATYTALDYSANGVNEDGDPVVNNFGGALNFGYFAPTATTAGPLSTFNITSGGTVNATFVNMASVYAGQNANINVTGGTLNSGLLSLATPAASLLTYAAFPANVANTASYNTSTATIGVGGVVNSGDVVASNFNTTKATINVAGGQLNVDGVILMGGTSGDTGAGSSDLNLTAGGTASCSQLNLGTITAAGAAASYSGNNVVVDGAGSKITVVGVPATDTTNAFGANMFIGDGVSRKSSVTVSNGGNITLASANPDVDTDGILIMGNGNNSVSSLTIDGVNSTVEAGVEARVFFASTAITGATATINIKNGGLFHTTFVDADHQGDVLLGVFDGSGSAVNVTVGGGSGASDADSFLDAEGVLYVGGNGGFGDAITTGTKTTITINNGAVRGGIVAVYPQSTIQVNKGDLIGNGSISLSGGTVVMSATGAPADAALLADTFEVESGGYFDIGKHGGVSIVSTATGSTETSATELAEIKALIVSGGIRSSLVSSLSSGQYAIGYAPRLPNATLTSFLGITFDPTDSAVLFRTTLRGDANLTGNVNFDDLIVLAQNYNTTGKAWYQGDFTYDGNVNFDDLIPLAQNYNQALPAALAAELGSTFASDWALARSLVPEPTTITVMATAGLFAAKRRRR